MKKVSLFYYKPGRGYSSIKLTTHNWDKSNLYQLLHIVVWINRSNFSEDIFKRGKKWNLCVLSNILPILIRNSITRNNQLRALNGKCINHYMDKQSGNE